MDVIGEGDSLLVLGNRPCRAAFQVTKVNAIHAKLCFFCFVPTSFFALLMFGIPVWRFSVLCAVCFSMSSLSIHLMAPSGFRKRHFKILS